MTKLNGKKYYSKLSMSNLEALERSKSTNPNKIKLVKENGELYLTSKCWENGGCFFRVTPECLADKDIVFKIMYHGEPQILKYASDEVKSDCGFMAKTISACKIYDAFPYFNITNMLKTSNDKLVVDAIVYDTLSTNPLLMLDYNMELLERRCVEKTLAGRKKYTQKRDYIMDNDTFIKFTLDTIKNSTYRIREFMPFQMTDKQNNIKVVVPKYNALFQEAFANFFAHNPTYTDNYVKEISANNYQTKNNKVNEFYAGLVRKTEKIGKMRRITEK